MWPRSSRSVPLWEESFIFHVGTKPCPCRPDRNRTVTWLCFALKWILLTGKQRRPVDPRDAARPRAAPLAHYSALAWAHCRPVPWCKGGGKYLSREATPSLSGTLRPMCEAVQMLLTLFLVSHNREQQEA